MWSLFLAAVVAVCRFVAVQGQSAVNYPPCRDFGFCSVASVGTTFQFFPVGISSSVQLIDLTGHPLETLRGDELQRFALLEEMYARVHELSLMFVCVRV